MKQVSTAGDDMPPAPVIIPESSGGERGQVRVDLPQASEAGEDEFFDVTLDMLPPSVTLLPSAPIVLPSTMPSSSSRPSEQ